MKGKTLLRWGDFTSHSGLKLPFKIDCDALSDEDIQCCANYITSKISFESVKGIPRGGLRLAKALEDYTVRKASYEILIVDDVLTTGRSMEDCKAKILLQAYPNGIVGWVIFARAETPGWITAIFTM